ncbi:bidirectional hydrogenase complex protein HoxE [Candidatus Poribacteria bacterium]|jgi:bidirectional [NiFe] hydrogenase diaphorase subunit|nr:bidirectional hydrogenase complex protein HoxE [Candidatus Poribacteria bacterium]MBT5532589.1 bidirectional hydrogenase complex protein HoxE [Candidatus Poribacteria bacterium]MBT5710684.1 bidirectional hydrogenase complex protein HoxE [Candidatus Poribacteria bacterium]MBT7101867.1 bidirectional hydrogenase complex protein HoxE [Candidatus Poribacteria bacterium]MBT7805050.1 bidirectional hydrogenase complex protein HoxE [Candidatus Poribacteria bacterium]
MTDADNASTAKAGGHPSGDVRFRILEATMKRHRYQGDALIEVLHTAQEAFGYLEPDLLLYIAHSLSVPPSRVFGVATFYHFFALKPQGEHTCVVCMGTACYVNGAAEILEAVEEAAGTKAGQTSDDGKLSVMTARCLGACGVAPAVVFDGSVAGKQDADTTIDTLKGLLTYEPAGVT